MNHLKRLPLYALAASLFVVGCKKDETTDPDGTTDGTTEEPVITCRIAQVVFSESGVDEETSKFYYNADKKIVKVEYINAGSSTYREKDTVIYDASGKISVVQEFQYGESTSSTTWNYTYSGDDIASVQEIGTQDGQAYTATTTVTYSGGKVSRIETTGDPNEENQIFSNFVYTGDNVTSADMDIDGTGQTIFKMTISTDDKANHAHLHIPYPEDLIEWASASNLTKVETKEDLTVDGFTIPAGSTIVEREYTYTADGNVETRTDKPTAFDEPTDPSEVQTFTYDCD